MVSSLVTLYATTIVPRNDYLFLKPKLWGIGSNGHEIKQTPEFLPTLGIQELQTQLRGLQCLFCLSINWKNGKMGFCETQEDLMSSSIEFNQVKSNASHRYEVQASAIPLV